MKKKTSTGKNRKLSSHPFDRSIKLLSPAQLAKLPGLKVLRASATEDSGYVAPPPQEKVLLSTPGKKRQFLKAKQKEHYTLKQLPIPPQKTFAGYVKYIESHSDEMNKLLNRGEYWAASYKGNKTHSLYTNIAKLMEDLNKYDDSQKYGNYRGKKENLVRKVQILKFKKTGNVSAPKEYQKIKKEEIQAREEEKSKRLAKFKVRAKRAEEKLKKETAAKKKLQAENRKLRAEAKRNAAKRTKKGAIKKASKVSKPATKKATKKGTKKPTPKKTVAPKKQVKKVVKKSTKKGKGKKK